VLPLWLLLLFVIFVVIALRGHRAGRHPYLQALLAVVVVLAYEGVHSHVL
jgi:hypothetical protein